MNGKVLDRPFRVVIQQPSLAKYRVPLYQALAALPNLDLHVVYGKDECVPNVEPEGFRATFEPHRTIGIGKRRPFVWQPAQLKYADPNHADVLVLVWNTRWLSLPLALRKARRKGVRTVVWGHGYSKNESPRRATLRRRVGLMADAMLFYSQTIADRYMADGVDPSRVFVAPNCLDQAPIQRARHDWLSDPARLAAFRSEYGVSVDSQPILYVSRFDPANRVDLLLQAAARLVPSHPHLRVHLIGKGEPEMSRLRAMARELGIGDRVRFLGAIYDEDRLAPWFLTAKAFCYPSNIGLSLHHAMGYGLPVITGDNADEQNPEFEALRTGENGLLYQAASAEKLAVQLRNLLDYPDHLKALSKGALETAANRYTIERMARNYAAAIFGQRAHPKRGSASPPSHQT